MITVTLVRNRIQEEEAEVELTEEQITEAGFDPEDELTGDDIAEIVNVDLLHWEDGDGWERCDDLSVRNARYYGE